jgi:hypothetical protein
MKKLIALSLLPAFALADLGAQESEFLAAGIYDTGRLQSNQILDGIRFSQWNGVNDNPGNVGWDQQGLWWSFVRFGSQVATHSNPELFDKLVAADEIHLHLGVLWNEIASSLVGIIPPGVQVGAYLVPEFDIPDGQLPTFQNAWPYVYTQQIKLFEIDPATVPTTNVDWNDYQFSPPTEQQRLENLVAYDITDGLKGAISQGLLDANTSWGIVFFNEEALPDLTPNNPDWLDARGTVFDMRYVQLELVSGGTPTWAGFPVGEDDNVDTGSFLGWINVASGDWVYSFSMEKYVYLPESWVTESGSWTYLPN